MRVDLGCDGLASEQLSLHVLPCTAYENKLSSE